MAALNQAGRTVGISPSSGVLTPAGLLLLYAVIGGGTFTVSKFALAAGVSPLSYTFWQVAGSAVLLLLYCGLKRIPLPLDGSHLRFYAICGVIGVALPNLNMYYALTLIPAGVMAVVVATIPFFTCTLSAAYRVEPLRLGRILGLLVGFAGAMIILLPRVSLADDGTTLLAAVAFLTPLLYAASHTFVARARPVGTEAIAIVTGMSIAATLALAPVAVESLYVPRFPLGPAELAILIQIAISTSCYLLFFRIVRLAGPVFFSQVGYLVTFTGLFWAIVIIDESYSAWLWLAMALILGGLVLVNGKPVLVRRIKA
jgi:drug/metabolite transporter (DMT)-like permease